MPPPSCTRRLTFCAGHRVMGHENKCANMHGHNYVVEVVASASNLDDIGRVIDFSVLKKAIGGWLDTFWDHAFIYYAHDIGVVKALNWFAKTQASSKTFGLDTNPTAENMAEYLLRVVCPIVLADSGVRVTAIRLYETENCWADAVL